MGTEIRVNPALEDITTRVYMIRGQHVMLDFDLAEIYGYEVKKLNQQVKRNIGRFPEDFMFRLSDSEIDSVRSQFVTSRKKDFFAGQEGGRRYLPYAFTEQGIYMLATVLRGEFAERQSIFIMRAFKEMRHFIANNALMFEKINGIELRQLEYQRDTEEKFGKIFAYMSDHKEDNQKIFYEGQIFDAFSLLTELIRRAKKEIILIDGYIDIVTLNILAKKNNGVKAVVYTLPGTRISAQDIHNFNAQYPILTIKSTVSFHDRFLIIDGLEGYHIGASLKDAGKKCFGINKINGTYDIENIVKRAQQNQ